MKTPAQIFADTLAQEGVATEMQRTKALVLGNLFVENMKREGYEIKLAEKETVR